MGTAKYTYKFRPGYGTKNYLIELENGPSDEFKDDLLDAISEIKPKLDKTLPLWVNDEIVWKYQSLVGEFEISRDVWDLIFVMNFEDDSSIQTIHEILKKNNKFESLDVNPEDYKLKDQNE